MFLIYYTVFVQKPFILSWSVNLTIHLHIVLRLRTCGDLPPLPHVCS